MVDENKKITYEGEISDTLISKEVRQKRICGLLLLSLYILNYQESEIDSDEEIPLLHQAMMADQEDIFTLLLESGANGDYLNESTKDSLLHIAIKKNRCTFVKILLEKGRVNYSIRNNLLGLTPLELSLKIADMLVEYDCFKTIVFHNHLTK